MRSAKIIAVVLATLTSLSLAQDAQLPSAFLENIDNLNEDVDEMVQNGGDLVDRLAEKYGLVVPSNYRLLRVKKYLTYEKPENGVCFRKAFERCQKPGARIPYRGTDSCVFCYCSSNRRKVCCKQEPYPAVRNPLACKIELNTDTCVYQRKPKCKTVCEIEGWWSSEIY